ncbi:hypothetical protein NC653_018146 [Populus alba x Populus x berolinensis]|uniref:Uncharacterized protein n=1 Tax=Populus alba x Populus x berolinensis TaxID=444605 RepID=A0AAD6QFT8_9ROSI|nr:hypothetical protein NC653_018146 [Populus alba x Populus x berolinensis]
MQTIVIVIVTVMKIVTMKKRGDLQHQFCSCARLHIVDVLDAYSSHDTKSPKNVLLGRMLSENRGCPGRFFSFFNQAPLFNFKGHQDEGYAIDCSPLVTVRLVIARAVFTYGEPTSGATWNVDATSIYWTYSLRARSCVCLLFCGWAYCHMGCTSGEVTIYFLFKAHNADVNVALMEQNMGSFSGKGMRKRKQEFKAKTKEQVNAPADLPPQLLFVHQHRTKRLERTSLTRSDSGDDRVYCHQQGFKILMPFNIQSTLTPLKVLEIVVEFHLYLEWERKLRLQVTSPRTAAKEASSGSALNE